MELAIGDKVSKTTTVNGKALSGNISLNASDVNALPSSTNITAIEVLTEDQYNALTIKNTTTLYLIKE